MRDQTALSDPRTDAALLATLHSSAGIEHHSPLIDAALDRDEDRAVRLLQQHIGIPDGLDPAQPSG